MRVRRNVRCRRHSVCVAFAVTGVCSTAFGELGLPVVLSYHAPTECPSAEQVLERVALLLRRQPTTPAVADARIERQADGYVLELSVDGGRRRLVSDSCDSLVETLSIILAMAIDPRGRTSTGNSHADANASKSPPGAALDHNAPPVAQPPVAQPPLAQPPVAQPPVAQPPVAQPPFIRSNEVPKVPAPSAPVGGVPSNRARAVTATGRQNHPEGIQARSTQPSESPVAPTESRATPVALHPSLLLWTEYGMLPRLANGPNLSLWIDRGSLSLAVTAEWLIPEWANMPDTESRRGGYVSFLGGQLALCWQALTSKWLGLCVGAEAGDMMGKGSGIVNRRLGHGIWLAGVTEVVSRVRLTNWLSADLRLGLAVPVKRPAFGFDDYAWKFAPEPWSVRVASGFSWF